MREPATLVPAFHPQRAERSPLASRSRAYSLRPTVYSLSRAHRPGVPA